MAERGRGLGGEQVLFFEFSTALRLREEPGGHDPRLFERIVTDEMARWFVETVLDQLAG